MKSRIENPWADLPATEPFVLESDRRAIGDFNAKAKDEFTLRLELLPEPYWGNPDAKVVLLNLNPGFSDDDVRLHRTNAEFVECCRRNLLHEEQGYPAFYLNPAFSDTPGYGYVRLRASTHRFLIIGFLCGGRVENYRSVWVECPDPFAEFYAAHVGQTVIENVGVESLLSG